MKKLLIALVAGFISVALTGAYAGEAMKKDEPKKDAAPKAATKAEAKAEAKADMAKEPAKTKRAAKAEKN